MYKRQIQTGENSFGYIANWSQGKELPELRDKSARLAELDVLLNMDGRGRPAPEAVLAKSSRPSVLELSLIHI